MARESAPSSHAEDAGVPSPAPPNLCRRRNIMEKQTPTETDEPRDEARSRKEKPARTPDLDLQALAGLPRWIGAHIRGLSICAVLGIAAYNLAAHPPFRSIGRGEIGLRVNQWTGNTHRFLEGTVLVVPGLHEIHTFSLREQVYRPDAAEFQSSEGLTLGVDFTARYALDAERLAARARPLSAEADSETVQTIIQDVFRRTFAGYGAREIASTRREEVRNLLGQELENRLAADGFRLKLLTIDKIVLPDILRDQVYHPDATGFQSNEGLTLGVDFTARYTLDTERLAARARPLPVDADGEIIPPAVPPIIQDVFRRTLAGYGAREIASTRREEIQKRIGQELETRLAAESVKLKLLSIGKITLPDILHDQVYHPDAAKFQTVEGLTLGVDFTVRYALDEGRIAERAHLSPADVRDGIALPIIQDAFHRVLSGFTVREIFSTRREEIQKRIGQALETRLAADGVTLKLLTIGRVTLPNDYKAGMEKMMAAELASEQMKYTLELKEKQVRERELSAEAEKVQREKAAEASAREEIIAAQAQAEAMKHILPFKEKQIQQRALEAEAEKVTRLKKAQADADARRIEAEAEADSRRKLAEAEAFRLEQIGRANSAQMEREGAILAQSPLLIQKTLAEKLSDKISVMIVPPGANGAFVGENLIGRLPAPGTARPRSHDEKTSARE
jgi:regulator of protease activity HflC (stomatin/prohibitin superfamily)